MIIIAHRGNLRGPNSLTENSLESIQDCFAFGFSVEVDIWFREGNFFLGHDFPLYKLEEWHYDLFRDDRMWFHVKNIEAAEELKKHNAHFFWHQEDDITLTSRGFFWTYPGKQLTANSIAVLPEIIENMDFYSQDNSLSIAAGICTDYPFNYINLTK